MGYGSNPSGYGGGGYGTEDGPTPQPVLAGTTGCTPLLRDEVGVLWGLSISDNGNPTITKTSLAVGHFGNPIVGSDPKNAWQLSVFRGSIIAQKITPPTILNPLYYVPLVSPGRLPWSLTTDKDGNILTTQTAAGLLPDVIPYPPDVVMSIYGNSPALLFCSTCGNASVTASADLSLWCCSCSAFVTPEDTNIVIVLDE